LYLAQEFEAYFVMKHGRHPKIVRSAPLRREQVKHAKADSSDLSTPRTKLNSRNKEIRPKDVNLGLKKLTPLASIAMEYKRLENPTGNKDVSVSDCPKGSNKDSTSFNPNFILTGSSAGKKEKEPAEPLPLESNPEGSLQLPGEHSDQVRYLDCAMLNNFKSHRGNIKHFGPLLRYFVYMKDNSSSPVNSSRSSLLWAYPNY
jgi:hypothetical protein